MSLTKIEMWLGISAIILIFGYSIMLVGNDLNKAGITLDAESQEYISNYAGLIKENNIDDYANNSSLEQKKKNPLVDFATSLPLVSDVLGGINFFIDKTKQIFSFLAIIYNFPSFFLQGFGLNVGAFSFVINIVATILFIAITIMAVRLVK